LSLDHIKEEDTIITIVLIFILGFVGVILLIEVVLWRVDVVVSSDPRQICQIRLVTSFDIGVNVRRLGIGVGLLLLILYIEAALDV
jgi:putative Mn2+ efflux pump MntP